MSELEEWMGRFLAIRSKFSMSEQVSGFESYVACVGGRGVLDRRDVLDLMHGRSGHWSVCVLFLILPRLLFEVII